MKKCPYCAEEIQDEAVKCRFCGEELDKTLKTSKGKNSDIFGVLALATAAMSLVILPIIFAPLGFIFALVALSKGKKMVGSIAMITSIVSLVIIVSAIQSCSNKLSYIGNDTYNSRKAKLNWEKNLKILDWGVDDSYSTVEYRFEVENVGTKVIKEAELNFYLSDTSGNTVLTKTDKFLYSFDNSMKPKEVRKIRMYIDKIYSKNIYYDKNFTYSFSILDYE